MIELFIVNKQKRSIIKARWAKKNLTKYLDFSQKSTVRNEKDEQIIWQYWHQGENNVPDLIKKCLASVNKYENNKKICVLSFDTVKNYVEIPQKYYELVNEKKIPIAIFSDIVRLYLLEKFGGMWIDATVMLTDKIPEQIWDSDFCTIQKNIDEDVQENRMSCYFIRAKKGCANIKCIKNSIENYWKENDFLINYFMFEHISTMLAHKTTELKSEWDNMPLLDGNMCGKLQEIMEKDFSEKEFEELKSKIFMHKLTYKKQPSASFNKYFDINICCE